MFNLDQAITEWRRQMAVGGIKTRAVLDELESHLREDIERQIRAGISADRAFETAVKNIGPASALKKEFRKSTVAVVLEKLMIATAIFLVAFIIFLTTAAMLLCYNHWSDRLTGFAALGFLLLTVFGWPRVVPFLPVIHPKRKRWVMEILSLLLGFGICTFYVQVIAHRFEVPGEMLPSMAFWGVFPIALGFDIACGLERAVQQARAQIAA